VARAILIFSHAVSLALIGSLSTAGHAAPPDARRSACRAAIAAVDSATQRSYLEFRQSIEAGPIFRAAGRVRSCDARADGSSIRLDYEFANGGALKARRDPVLELTEQQLTTTRISKKDALATLQRTEKWAFGEHGCGIAWQSPDEEPGAAPGTFELAYRGDSCNCQSRLVYREQRLTALGFRSAC
jgi:hypothetical protein